MISRADPAKAAAQAQGVKRVNDWLEEALPDEERDEDDGGSAPPGKETNVIVNQLACKEVGCPDVEVVITLKRAKPRPRLMFKIYKAAAELTREEVVQAMHEAERKESEEQAGQATDTHDHGHAEAEEGHHADGDCDCGHDHEHGEETQKRAEPDSGHEHDHNAS
eukprot:CAMPEP_0174720876 /NCGR_PEP_ID=MMETSP1094-20130205/34741_1 /TAXON_ID=156173 /ORGANISM="Chrysochromulina brevifilum, Strain UTEX LB 985" /LENGTH=164 /DNA_ID=CAMNT_0015921451 /DNA_START=27 /DNA_END=521 /DNA_ORIENTATION=+